MTQAHDPKEPPRIRAVYPLTPMQQGMLFHTLLHPESDAYVVQLHCELEGEVEVAALRGAFQAAVDQHAVLRTVFPWDRRDQPLQAVLSRAELPFCEHDLSALPAAAQAARVDELMRADRQRGFDLKLAPLLRVSLIRLGPVRQRLLWTSHHLVLDGWSTALVLADVARAYSALREGRRCQLPHPPPFADYVRWLGDQDRSRARAFFEPLLRGSQGAAVLDVASRQPRPRAAGEPAHAECDLRLAVELSAAVRRLAAEHRVTEHAVLMAAFCLLLARYTDRREVCVGMTVSGRPAELPGALDMVGLFIQTLPVVARVREGATGRSWLQELQRLLIEVQGHHAVSAAELRAWSGVRGDRPLFEQVFVFENYPDAPADAGTSALRIGELQAIEQPDQPLVLVVAPGERIAVRALFAVERLAIEDAERLLVHYRTLLESLVAAPDAPLAQLEMLPAEERQQLEAWQRGPHTGYAREAGLWELFATQVARDPTAPALVDGARSFAYAELAARADAIARALRARGVSPGDRVALVLPAGFEFVAVMLGVLRAGGVYVPLDLASPAPRLAFMLREAAARFVVCAASCELEVPGDTNVLAVDALGPGGEDGARADLACGRGAAPAYVMFTSGSTGTPKGILVPQRAIARLVTESDFLDLRDRPRVALASNLSFDATTLELWAALLRGGCLVVIERETLLVAAALRTQLERSRIDLLWLTAGLFHRHARTDPGMFAAVDHLICGGDVVDPELVRAVQRAGGPRRFLNGYGPTENTTFTTVGDMRALRDHARNVPIGRPIAHTDLCVVDGALRRVPIGVPGELLAGGDGLAFGYAGRPRLTAERFIPHPFSEMPGARLYRTGDIVRMLDDGCLEFLGRRDGQVKLRGYRVEVAEIERVLAEHPEVQQALVVARRSEPEVELRLIGYVVGSPDLEVESLRSFVARHLPDYMVPAAFVSLGSLPLNDNGKVDRSALPEPQASGSLEAGSRELGSGHSTLEILAGIWAEVLHIPRPAPDASFFELGGHSLAATVVLSRIRKAFGLELPLRRLFDVPRLGELARHIERVRRERACGADEPPLAPVPRDRPLPLSFAQQRLWFMDRFAPLSAAYHIPHAIALHGALEVERLERAFELLVHRHEALRTALPEIDGVGRQVIRAPEPLVLRVHDLSDLPASERHAARDRWIEREAEELFDLSVGPLFRAAIIRLEPELHVLCITLHHIVGDGWSIQVFARELSELYAAGVGARPAELPELAVQYADFAVWQHAFLRGDRLNRQLEYFREQLAGLQELELPSDRPRRASPSFRGAALPVCVPAALRDSLSSLARANDCTLFMVLLATFFTWLYRYTGQTDLTVGSPVANRNRQELEGLIGFFVNMLALRVDLNPRAGFTQLLNQVRETTLGAYDHQDVPFELVVEQLRPERHPSRHPLFQLTLALHELPDSSTLELPGVRVGEVRAELAWVRYDLELHLWPSDDGLSGYLAYSTDLFDAITVERAREHWLAVLQAVVERPSAGLDSHELVRGADRDRQLAALHAPELQYEHPWGVHTWFFECAARWPEREALVMDGGERLSYAQLAARVRRLARALAGRGVRPEDRVALLCERSPELVVAMLAVLQAGAAYVPLDPQHPDVHLARLMQRIAPRLVVCQERLAHRVPEGYACASVEALESSAPLAAALPGRKVYADQLAYAIFTSGSTGEPKLIGVSHRALRNHMAWMLGRFSLGASDAVLQKTATTFDASVWEFWAPLLSGARLVLAQPGVHADPEYLTRALVAHAITALQLVPSVLELCVATPGFARDAPLRWLFVGGERLDPALVSRARACTRADIVNLYGPAEATIDATSAIVTCAHESAGVVPIGTPIANVRAYVLDRALRLLPPGAAGELCLAGEGLARGYLGSPARTAERFLPDPCSGQPGARLYRTGDRVRQRADGALEYLGREDRQLKLRGQRIEAGEIEAHLRAYPGVREAAVGLWASHAGPALVAHVVCDAEVGPAAVGESTAGERVEAWRSLYTAIYRDDVERDPTFDLRGWNDSYTGQPLPADQMRRWLDTALERIRVLSPRRVLEVGTGSGLILFGLAPHVEAYRGLDFSEPAIERLRRTAAARGLANVQLEVRAAHQLDHVASGSVDTVVLNSVAQYFPSLDYLLDVLRQAIDATAEGGAIFLGDLRSLPLLEAFHLSLELARAPAELSGPELLRFVRLRGRREEELVLDPALFHALAVCFPRVREVRIELKRGPHDNELTRYRYDVTLRLDRAGAPAPRKRAGFLDPEALASQLATDRPAQLAIERVRNPRVWREHAALEALSRGEVETAGELAGWFEQQRAQEGAGIDPEEYVRVAGAAGYRVEITWSQTGSAAEYDVHLSDPRCVESPPLLEPAPSRVEARAALARYANVPCRAFREQTWVPAVRRYLQDRLPAASVPSALLVIDALPLTLHGKLDRARLPLPDGTAGTETYQRPVTETEREICAVWSQLLGRECIGIHDDFFAAGGHSLLVVMLAAQLCKLRETRVSIAELFQHTTVHAQAKLLDAQVRAPETAAGLVREADALVTVFNPGRERLLFCFPPLLGYGLAFRDLCSALSEYTCVALDFPHREADPIERWCELVERHQPEGALVCLGYSAGGPAAFAVARRLEQRGRAVSDLLLLDAAFTGRSTPTAAEGMDAIVEDNLQHFEEHMLRDPSLRLQLRGSDVRREMSLKMRGYMQFLDALEPCGRVAARAHVLLAERADRKGRIEWAHLVDGPVRVHEGSGVHLEMAVGEHARANAAIVRRVLGDPPS